MPRVTGFLFDYASWPADSLVDPWTKVSSIYYNVVAIVYSVTSVNLLYDIAMNTKHQICGDYLKL